MELLSEFEAIESLFTFPQTNRFFSSLILKQTSYQRMFYWLITEKR